MATRTGVAVYVALSRNTDAIRLFLLSPVSLEHLSHPQDADVAAHIGYLEQLDEDTLALFLDEPSTFRPVRATPIAGPSRTLAYDPLPSLLPKESSNCFFNAAMAAALAAWDDCPLPDPCFFTPAGAVFPALAAVRTYMFDGRAFQNYPFVELPRRKRHN